MKTVTAEYLVSRWEDRHRVQNLMGIYSQHHLIKREGEIFTALWSTAQDVSLATNEGYYVSRDAVEGYGIATTYLTHMSGREPFFQVDGTVKFGPMEDSYYDYLTMLHQWYEEGLIWNDFVSYTERFNQPPDGGITSGQFGVWFSSYQNFPIWTASAEDPNFHIVAFSDPVQKEGDVNHLRAENFLVTNGGVGISTSCENVELAAKLIDYWFSDEGRYFLTFGIEGTTYELD